MGRDTTGALELALWQGVAGLNLSPSHDSVHISRVKHFARLLMDIYGGDPEVLLAAVILHDLGRADSDHRHGLESIEASVDQARLILKHLHHVDLPGEKIDRILRAIDEHDQPELRPSTVEGRILKDADFLAGFGAWGILRIAMWSGESGRITNIVRAKIGDGMWRRFHNLEFPESRRIAQRDLAFAALFLQELDRNPGLPSTGAGRYIVIEGISGTGKDTQAKEVEKKLRKEGWQTLLVQEPTDAYRAYRDIYEKRTGTPLQDPDIMHELFVADRIELLKGEVLPALRKGAIVISVRSYLSTMVYQCSTEATTALTAYQHDADPHPDLVILLDVDPSTAWQRIGGRLKERGAHETPGQLETHRNRYLELARRYFPESVTVIDASLAVEDVAKEVWKAVDEVLPPKSRR
jgi:dTMP kinase